MRVYDWPERLYDFICNCRNKEFTWGEFDCCLFVCDAIKEMTGIDPAEQFRGTYREARGAVELIQSYGDLGTLVETVCNQNGFEEIAVNFAQTGDVVLVVDESLNTNLGEGHPTLAIMGADGHALVPVEVGLASVPRSSATRAWRV